MKDILIYGGIGFGIWYLLKMRSSAPAAQAGAVAIVNNNVGPTGILTPAPVDPNLQNFQVQPYPPISAGSPALTSTLVPVLSAGDPQLTNPLGTTYISYSEPAPAPAAVPAGTQTISVVPSPKLMGLGAYAPWPYRYPRTRWAT